MNTETTTVAEAEKSQSCPLAIVKRAEGQSYKEFSEKRAETNKMIRHFLKGILVHDNSNGTYDVGRNQTKREKRAFNGTHKKINYKLIEKKRLHV